MGFSGKPSKGCAPCRQKRTKCDLAQPACTQCIRKNRVCTGYRDELSIIFRDETKHVEQKARRGGRIGERPGPSINPDALVLQYMTPQPSRAARVDDEAINHFFAHYNEKFFSSDSGHGGFDYILPVYMEDAATGGPIPDIVKAAGLAALGNMKGAPELLVEARRTQNKVLRQLYQQLQNPLTRTSNSTILTCIMLGVFENIICDSPQSTQAMTYHLNGASQMAAMRGPKQFLNDVGHGIYTRMRGFILAHCLQTREPLPDFVVTFMDDIDIEQRDFSPEFVRLLARLCRVRADHKNKGIVDDDMIAESRALMDEFAEWQPQIPGWNPNERPLAAPTREEQGDLTYRYVWLATVWIFKHTALILTADLIIEWARAQLGLSHASPAAQELDEAIEVQATLCDDLKNTTEYYLENFAASQSAMRTVGGYGLLWPLYVLSTASTCTLQTMIWIARQGEKIAEQFGIRQAKTLADVMWLYTRQSPTYTSTTSSSG